MTDFLLELRCEEIPARMQAKAAADLAELFAKNVMGQLAGDLAKGEIASVNIQTFVTPRRLALIARGLPDATEAVSEEAKGPPEGAPDAALDGFCRKAGVTRDQLELRDVKGRNTYFAVIEKPGRATRDVLAEAIPAIVRAFPWPKSMRWGAASQSTESLRWVRPLHGIVAIFGTDLVECSIGDVTSGFETLGHRFHHHASTEKVGTGFASDDATKKGRVITIGGADDYVEKLRACHVVVDPEERRAIIRDGAKKLAADKGLDWIVDEALVAENAGLTEWPVPLLGDFDERFLDVPREVIQLTLATNQKYFVLNDADGKLAPAFICVANIAANDGGAAIVDGNRKVLAARLSDARHFWDQDRRKTLAQHAEGLARITFHEKLGTLADKVERVAKLARWLVKEGIVNPSPHRGEAARLGGSPPSRSGEGRGDSQAPNDAPGTAPLPNPLPDGERESLAALAERAAQLAKADLVTEMVGEFPELQGVIGGYYARAEGLPDAVADAIRDHYKPVGQGDAVPTAPVTVAVSLADKLDTSIGFFAIGERPSGSKDPFALRRAAIAIVRLITLNEIRLPLRDAFLEARRLLLEQLTKSSVLISERSWDEEWDELPEVRSPISSEQAEGLISVKGIPEENRLPTLGHNEWFVYPGAVRDYGQNLTRISGLLDLVQDLMEYFLDRVEDLEKREGLRIDFIRAVIPKDYIYFDLDPSSDGTTKSKYGPSIVRIRQHDAQGPDDLVRLLARVKALQAFIETPEGTNLLAGYKRAANILKKEGWGDPAGTPAKAGVQGDDAQTPDQDAPGLLLSQEHDGEKPLSYNPENAETALIAALDSAEPAARDAIGREDFAAAMAALASLRAPIDTFFEEVIVNDPDPAKRAARLALLARIRAAVHAVADFSKIEG